MCKPTANNPTPSAPLCLSTLRPSDALTQSQVLTPGEGTQLLGRQVWLTEKLFKMDQAILENIPQAGTRKGESRTVASAAVCPPYSGVGTKSLRAGQDVRHCSQTDLSNNMDTEQMNSNDPGENLDCEKMEKVRKARNRRLEMTAEVSDALSVTSLSETELAYGKRLYSEVSGGSDTETGGSRTTRAAKRGNRGGGVVSVSKARAALRERKEEERESGFQAMLEKSFFRKTPKKAEASERQIPFDPSTMKAEELMLAATDHLGIIAELTGKSTALKGGYSAKIRRATSSIREVLDVLVSRTEAEETRRLKADNARLERDIGNLREELRAYRRDYEEGQRRLSESPKAPMTTDQLAVLESNIARLVGNLIDGRLAGIEARLPKEVCRPPLASDNSPLAKKTRREVAEAQRALQPVSSEATSKNRSREDFPLLLPPVHKETRSTKGGRREEVWTAFGPSSSSMPNVGSSQRVGTEGVWTEVVRKKASGKKKQKADKTAPSKEKVVAQPQTQKPKLKLPRSTAVIIKLRPEAIQRGATYSSALLKAEEKVDLRELGIGPLRIRQSADGARLLEIPGSSSGEKADALAASLKAALHEEIEVLRPVMKANLRLTGLSDAVTVDRLRSAISEGGGCPEAQVTVKNIRTSLHGTSTAHVEVPAAAANKMLQQGHLAVGWSRVQLHLLAARPRHCFRCLGMGHVARTCPMEVDRSGLCYRCGKEGHKAADCSGLAKCVVCSDAGRSAAHVMGGINCRPPITRGKLPAHKGIQGSKEKVPEAEMSE